MAFEKYKPLGLFSEFYVIAFLPPFSFSSPSSLLTIPNKIFGVWKVKFIQLQDKKAPVFALDLMAWCWQQEADKRPSSHHILLLASTTEFPRLSDVITFEKQVSAGILFLPKWLYKA